MPKRPTPSLAASLQAIRFQRLGLPSSFPPAPASPIRDSTAPSHSAPNDSHTTSAALVGLQRARLARVRPPHELSIAAELDSQARLIRSVQRGVLAAGVAWEQLLAQSGVAPHLLDAARIRSFRRGVLTIQVRDASAKFQLARLLRAGGEARLARLAPVSLHKVKLTL